VFDVLAVEFNSPQSNSTWVI